MELNHWDRFAEFCLLEKACGGPDPQIPLVGEMSKLESWEERVWRAGCYISVYNVPFAESIWENWSWKDVQGNMIGFREWLNSNWSKIVTRFERRTVRRPEWMFEYFNSYYAFIQNDLAVALKYTNDMSPEERYLHFWDLTNGRIKRFGRYVALKLLESYRLYCNMNLVAPDIRPKDGWSPRITLAALYPNIAEQLTDKSNYWNDVVNGTVIETIDRLKSDYDVEVDKFQLQVMLCEYRESYHSKKQYPGRSHDSELGYWHKREGLWGKQDYSQNMLQARKKIFPSVSLGELNGWDAPRGACGRVLAEHGYTWTDLLYDYQASWMNMSKPVWRRILQDYEA